MLSVSATCAHIFTAIHCELFFSDELQRLQRLLHCREKVEEEGERGGEEGIGSVFYINV